MLSISPGQWALFVFEDSEWIFQRSYSIVDYIITHEKTTMTFCIYLTSQWRGSALVKDFTIGQKLIIQGIYGTFTLQNTTFPKVFIGLWLWIIPLIAMAKHCMTKKQLFFSVAHKKDIFYEERIKNIPGLRNALYISQESVPGYRQWRIDITKEHFDPQTEFYISWKAESVTNIVHTLTILWYKRIYTEML